MELGGRGETQPLIGMPICLALSSTSCQLLGDAVSFHSIRSSQFWHLIQSRSLRGKLVIVTMYLAPQCGHVRSPFSTLQGDGIRCVSRFRAAVRVTKKPYRPVIVSEGKPHPSVAYVLSAP